MSAADSTGEPLGRTLAVGASLAVAYVASAKAGLLFAFVAEQVTTVWAPTGIAVASLLLWGPRVWPAIWLGAFVVNAGTSAPLWTAFVVASGNTLEGVVAASVLRRVPTFDFRFERTVDVLTFVAIGVVGCTTLSATVGTITLCAAGVQAWSQFGSVWFDWWLGDALGALVVAPPILTIACAPRPNRIDSLRFGLFVGSAVVVTHLAFGPLLGLGAHPLEYVVFPLMIAAAIVGGPPLTSVVVLMSSAVTIWNTVRGAGPFAGFEVHHNLVLLQIFTAVLGTTALLLSAAIAERKTIELRHRNSAELLRQRERMLRLAQRAGGVATFEWDFKNQIANCSAEFFAIFGQPRDDGEIKGAEWAGFVHPDDRERMAAHLARALEGVEPATADYRIIRADGVERWLTYAGQVEHLPHGARMLGTVLDVTDRKRLEAELRYHADEIERILESIGEGFVTFDREFRYLYVNRAAESMLGRSKSELIGHVAWDIFPEEAIRESRQLLEGVQSSGTLGRYEVHVPGWDRWFEYRVYPSETGLSIFFIDVTARVKGEAALHDAKNAAEAANRVKDQFLATLSHELRTPLNAILGYARMLQTNSIAPDKRQRAIDIIERNAVAQNQLIEDLLDISRITRGQVRLEAAPIPIAAVLRDAIEGVRPAAEAKRIALDVNIDPFAGIVNADATRLQQVFWNLLTNAVKFTEQGGNVTTALRRVGQDVEITVADSGAGISPDFLPFIFEPFRQQDGSFTRGNGGLGLGLAISRQLVELHGGTVTATSAGIGQGATFVVRLPAQAEVGTPAAPPGTTPGHVGAVPGIGSLSLAGVDVLLVDDEEDTLTLFQESLEAAGATVRAVSSAAEALRENRERAPDLLVADLALPAMDGFELLRTIRATNPAIPAVAVTAYARLDDRARSRAAGFQAHVAKPIDPTAFVRVLIAAVSNAS